MWSYQNLREVTKEKLRCYFSTIQLSSFQPMHFNNLKWEKNTYSSATKRT